MSSDIPRALDHAVRVRAGHRCEYCRLAQDGQEATFHVDHVLPRALGGETESGNLALACVSCSLRKGAAAEGFDPETGASAPLFHPRRQAWQDHFHLDLDASLSGLTAEGRATVTRLKMNRPLAIRIRLEEVARGRYP